MRVAIDDAAGRVELHRGQRHVLERVAEELLLLGEPALGADPLGDVLGGDDEAGGASAVGLDRAGGGAHVRGRAVGPADPELGVEAAALAELGRPPLEDAGWVVAPQDLEPAIATHVVEGTADDLAEAPIRIPAAAALVGLDDPDRRVLGERPEPLLRLAQRLLAAVAGR